MVAIHRLQSNAVLPFYFKKYIDLTRVNLVQTMKKRSPHYTYFFTFHRWQQLLLNESRIIQLFLLLMIAMTMQRSKYAGTTSKIGATFTILFFQNFCSTRNTCLVQFDFDILFIGIFKRYFVFNVYKANFFQFKKNVDLYL